MYGLNLSIESIIIMSVIWLVLFRIYLYYHKKVTGGFIQALLDGKYNDMFIEFGKKMLEQHPELIWAIIKRVLMSEVKPGEYRLNEKARLFMIHLMNEGLAYMDHSMMGSYGKAVQNGDIPNLNELSDVAPATLMKGRKVFGKWGPIAMKGLKVLDSLSDLKGQFEKVKGSK